MVSSWFGFLELLGVIHAHQVPQGHLDWPVSILCSLDLARLGWIRIYANANAS